MAARLKKGDKVVVISGRDRGKNGEIVRVIPDRVHGDQVLIRGIQFQSKTMKPNPAIGQQGGVIKRETAIRASNVALADPIMGQRTRVGFSFVEREDEVSGEVRQLKIRRSKKTQAEID